MNKRLTNGCQMAFEDVGRGPLVVLLHAFPLDGRMWQAQRDALAATHRVITPDQRGFGGTDGFDGAPSIEQMADDVAALLEALAITEPVVLGGLSMGGYVALAFARKHGSRLRALILADTKADADTVEAKANRDKTIAFMATHTGRELIEQMMPKMLSPQTLEKQPAVVEQVRELAGAQSPAGIRGGLAALRDRADANVWLGQIQVPALVLVGTDDALTPPSAAVALAGGIKRATMKTLSAAGHLSNLEQPTAYNEALRQFLRSV